MLPSKEIHNRVKKRLIPLILQYEKNNALIYQYNNGFNTFDMEDMRDITTTQHLDKPGGNGEILSLCNSIYKDIRGKGNDMFS